MSKKILLTPKDCLYMEDIINASMLIYKKTQLESDHLQSKELKAFLDDICTDLKDLATHLANIMKGAKS